MASLDNIGIGLEGIAHVLADNHLRVPAFQRSYAWEEVHVTDLLRDLSAAIQTSTPEYFLGSVVVSTEESKALEVVDGQQRLATTAIILAGVRDYFINVGDDARADTLESDYLLKRDLRTQDSVPRMTLNELDNDFFQKAVFSRPGSADRGVTPSRASHRRILAARKAVATYIATITSATNKKTELLLDWVEYLHKAAKIILVRVPDHANAFTIFETLNDRGLDLAISDLLKNYLFYRAEKRLPEVQATWASMLGALAAVSEDSSIVDYIRHFWSSRYGATRERELYSEIRKKVSSKQAAVNLGNSLDAGARRYAAILSHSHELWSDYGTSTRQHIDIINLLRMVQVRPLLLALLDKFSVPEAKKAIRLIVSWGVRFLIDGRLGGGVLERHYSERAREITAGEITTAAQLTKAMLTEVPTDAEFRDAFSVATVSQAYLARYYLRALEKAAAKEAEPELVPNPNEEEINLEHVLPLKTEGNWPQFDGESEKAYQKRIGNLVLLQFKVNSAQKSGPFSKKKTSLSQSKFKLTSEVGAAPKWDKKAIEIRQKELAELAIKTWPLK